MFMCENGAFFPKFSRLIWAYKKLKIGHFGTFAQWYLVTLSHTTTITIIYYYSFIIILVISCVKNPPVCVKMVYRCVKKKTLQRNGFRACHWGSRALDDVVKSLWDKGSRACVMKPFSCNNKDHFQRL